MKGSEKGFALERCYVVAVVQVYAYQDRRGEYARDRALTKAWMW